MPRSGQGEAGACVDGREDCGMVFGRLYFGGILIFDGPAHPSLSVSVRCGHAYRTLAGSGFSSKAQAAISIFVKGHAELRAIDGACAQCVRVGAAARRGELFCFMAFILQVLTGLPIARPWSKSRVIVLQGTS